MSSYSQNYWEKYREHRSETNEKQKCGLNVDMESRVSTVIMIDERLDDGLQITPAGAPQTQTAVRL